MRKLLLIAGVILVNVLNAQSFENGEKIFKQNCAACHKMDKKVVGPALQNVVSEQGAEWVYKWVKNNQQLRESGDSHANEVYEEYNGSAMPPYEWLGEESLNDVVHYLGEWKGKQQASVVPVSTSGPTMVQQAPYEMPVFVKILMGFVLLMGCLTAFMGVKTTRIIGEAYVNNQMTTTYLMKKQGMNEKLLNDEFNEHIDEEVNKRLEKKVKELKKDLSSKLKDFT